MTSIPSFEHTWQRDTASNPRIYVLDIYKPAGRENRDAQPLGSIVVEREEVVNMCARTGEFRDAHLKLFFNRIEATGSHRANRPRSYFSASCSRDGNGGFEVSLTSPTRDRGAVFQDVHELKGHRIGTFIMNQLIEWVKQWPNAHVREIELLDGQAEDENRERRNRFYEQFGLKFNYTSAARREGRSLPMRVRDLNTVDTWKRNIKVRTFSDYLGDLLWERDRTSTELTCRDRAVKELVKEMRANEEQPLRWALRLTWWRWAPTLAGLGVVGVFGAAVWRGLSA